MAAPDSTSNLQRWTLLHEAAQCRGVLITSEIVLAIANITLWVRISCLYNMKWQQISDILYCRQMSRDKLSDKSDSPHHPSLSAALTLTPKSSRNFTIWWWPAQTALWRGVIPSSFGVLGLSTWGWSQTQFEEETVDKLLLSPFQVYNIGVRGIWQLNGTS